MFVIVSAPEFTIVGLRTTKELADACVEVYQPQFSEPLIARDLEVDPPIEETNQPQNRGLWRVLPS